MNKNTVPVAKIPQSLVGTLAPSGSVMTGGNVLPSSLTNAMNGNANAAVPPPSSVPASTAMTAIKPIPPVTTTPMASTSPAPVAATTTPPATGTAVGGKRRRHKKSCACKKCMRKRTRKGGVSASDVEEMSASDKVMSASQAACTGSFL